MDNMPNYEKDAKQNYNFTANANMMAAIDGKLVIAGGYDGNGKGLNNAWEFVDCGKSWTWLTEHASFVIRKYPTMAAIDGKLMIAGGYDGNGKGLNDAWESVDCGKSWTWLTEHASFVIRKYPTMAAIDGKLVIAGGYDGNGKGLNDAWKSGVNFCKLICIFK
eukprot:Mrub_13712.p3 GENE.Mrub_13712~~Mrub_13712.p3  ORF type:complete len:163 (-),score=27.03 Mrub_13712:9-497(-)